MTNLQFQPKSGKQNYIQLDCSCRSAFSSYINRFSRLTQKDEWKPLRKVDCLALNMNNGVDPVLIEGGRATADSQNGIIRYNFYNAPRRLLTSAIWFVKEEKPKKEVLLQPMKPQEQEHVESVYQKVIEANSSGGKQLDSILNVEHFLEGDDYKIVIHKSGRNNLSMKKKTKGLFGATIDLQRGYSDYSVDGEEEETTLGPLAHVIFVVHGIGQAFSNREGVNDMTFIQKMDGFRLSIQQRQLAEWKQLCKRAQDSGKKPPPIPNRVEILPIEWWDKIHDSSSALVQSLRATTLPTIPGLRTIAKDVIVDILIYLTPSFSEKVLSCVTMQLNNLVDGVKNVYPDFLANGGKFSLIGHSLGSVIVWDLLSILKDNTESSINIDSDISCGVHLPESAIEMGYQGAYAAKTDQQTDQQEMNAHNCCWGPYLPKSMTDCILFTPEFTIFLGSPLGMFLSLRGAHAAFSEMLQLSIIKAHDKSAKVTAEMREILTTDLVKLHELQAKLDEIVEPITSPFALPSGSVYNIFHPSDPVAYRIEPLLLSEVIAEGDLPPPSYLTRQGKQVRPHVQAKEFSKGFLKSCREQKNIMKRLIHKTMKPVKALQVHTDEHNNLKGNSCTELKLGPLSFALGGKSNRIDYSIQPGVIENEYFSAVSAHSSYFVNPDVIDFILDLTLP